MGYVNTLWEMPPPEATDYESGDLHGRGTYGTMQLVRTPWKDELGVAADLTGLSEECLKRERTANAGGGAALLADIVGEKKPPELDGWYEVVAEYGGNELYPQEVFGVLEDGASATISTGEDLNLAPQEVDAPQIPTNRAAGADYGRADWRPAYRSNYSNRDRSAPTVDYTIIHIAQGSYSGTIGWFQHRRANVSAHYVVGRTGRVAQCVRNADVAWHAGNWTYNRKSIGIEHAGYAGRRWTVSTYRSSARLSAYLCGRFNIPVEAGVLRGSLGGRRALRLRARGRGAARKHAEPRGRSSRRVTARHLCRRAGSASSRFQETPRRDGGGGGGRREGAGDPPHQAALLPRRPQGRTRGRRAGPLRLRRLVPGGQVREGEHRDLERGRVRLYVNCRNFS